MSKAYDTTIPFVCTSCGATDRRHAKGLCKRCYASQHYYKDYEDTRQKRRAYSNGMRATNPEKARAQDRRYYGNNPEKCRAATARWRLEHSEEDRERQRLYRLDHLEEIRARDRAAKAEEYLRDAEKILLRNKQWRENNPEKVRAYNDRYYQENREAILAYKAAHPESNRANVKRHRARKLGAAISDFTHGQWVAMQEIFDHRCAYCQRRAKGHLTQDHITPLSKGGNHTASNMVPACKSCNSRKGTREAPRYIQPLLFI